MGGKKGDLHRSISEQALQKLLRLSEGEITTLKRGSVGPSCQRRGITELISLKKEENS